MWILRRYHEIVWFIIEGGCRAWKFVHVAPRWEWKGVSFSKNCERKWGRGFWVPASHTCTFPDIFPHPGFSWILILISGQSWYPTSTHQALIKVVALETRRGLSEYLQAADRRHHDRATCFSLLKYHWMIFTWTSKFMSSDAIFTYPGSRGP